ncbi:MAG: hypothetical protein JST40_07140 [Armatimonadetes bacterium]|nr:hypothetical protein [Armatimonadota bacterium]
MKRLSALTLAALMVLSTAAVADDLLGKNRGGGGGKGSGGDGRGGNPPADRSGGGRGSGGDNKGGNPPVDRGGGGGRNNGGGAPPADRAGGGGRNNGGGNPPADRAGGGRNNGGVAPSRPNPPVNRDRGNQGNGGSRIDTNRSNRDTGAGRSGTSRYGSQSNRTPSRQQVPPQRYDIPRRDSGNNSGRGAQEATRNHRAEPKHNYREGYYHYDRNWRDDRFCYPYYNFSWSNNCVISPWYGYYNLPGYVSYARVSFTIPQWRFAFDGIFTWNSNSNYGRDDRWDQYCDNDLRDAVYDIESVWQNGDTRALDRLISGNDRVVIRSQNAEVYTVRPDDFYDMMRDAALDTRTNRYDIERVSGGRGGARVIARHEFYNAWNQREVQYHSYILEQGRRGYQIVEFGTWEGFPR